MSRFNGVRRAFGCVAGLSCLLLLMTLDGPGAATAADKPFYEGKTIRVLVPFSPGGGTDNYARFAARHWVKYIPGNPKILVQNLPGGGGALTFGYLYSKASRDGLTLAVASEGIPVRRLLRRPGHTYEFTKMSLIASAPSSSTHYAGKTLGIKELKDLKKAGGKSSRGIPRRVPRWPRSQG